MASSAKTAGSATMKDGFLKNLLHFLISFMNTLAD
jgi:hypothetical protein